MYDMKKIRIVLNLTTATKLMQKSFARKKINVGANNEPTNPLLQKTDPQKTIMLLSFITRIIKSVFEVFYQFFLILYNLATH